jgi:hypothetical protein
MAIVNSLQRLQTYPYSNYTTAAAVALTGTVNTVVNASSTPALGTQGYTNGLVRVKVYNGSTTGTVTIAVSVTDGTSTFVVGTTTAAASVPLAVPTSGVDIFFWINVDINITGVTITTVTSAGTASMDYEILLNP